MNRDACREWTATLYRRWSGGEPDAYSTFIHLLETACSVGCRVIDLGCGDESYLAFMGERAGEIIGVDDRPLQGSYQRYVVADLNRDIPLDPGSVDLAACKFLVEHLENPASFLRQVNASLRSGGRLVVMTPNIIYYPYFVNYLLSRLLDQSRRMRLVEMFSGRPVHDIFPVHYRCNTPRKMRVELERAGFAVTHLDTYSDCCVSAVIKPLGLLAVAYEKLVGFLGIKWARGFMIAVAVKR